MSSVWVCRNGNKIFDNEKQILKCEFKHKATGICCKLSLQGSNKCDAAEYAPVVRGKWELYQPNACFLAKYRCSVCKEEHRNPSEKYCPSCGAKMEEQ